MVPIINAAGPATRFSGMPLHPQVVEAMSQAAQQCFRIDELQEAAGRYLTGVTGAEAGYVTSGAAAGLALGAAACIARFDPAAMDRLPETQGLRNEIIIQRGHVTSYTRALRVAGARLVEVGYVGYPAQGITWPWQIEAAISDRTAAVAFNVGNAAGMVPVDEVVAVAHRRGIPVIVDAAAALPPSENLRYFVAMGADLVVFSGGKAIGGPQASGILVGRRDLIESVALQHQDMDVRLSTWKGRERYLDSGRLPGPPNHGIGRAMKVGKEQIIGLVAALNRFLLSDKQQERDTQDRRLATLAQALRDLPGTRLQLLTPEDAPRPYPTLVINVDEAVLGKTVESLINELLDGGSPPVAVSQNFMDQRAIGIVAVALKDDQVAPLGERLVRVLAA